MRVDEDAEAEQKPTGRRTSARLASKQKARQVAARRRGGAREVIDACRIESSDEEEALEVEGDDGAEADSESSESGDKEGDCDEEAQSDGDDDGDEEAEKQSASEGEAEAADVEAAAPGPTAANGAQRRTAKKTRKADGADEGETPVICVSVTIQEAGQDIGTVDGDAEATRSNQLQLLDKLDSFLVEKCVSGLFSQERGGVLSVLHVQGVVRVRARNAASVTKLLKAHLGFGKGAVAPWDRANVLCKALTGRGHHTYTFMLGYCSKDAAQQHYAVRSHNVTDAELKEGKELHMKVGAGPLKNVTLLTPTSIFKRTFNYWYFHMGQRPNATFKQVLLSLIRTGKFMPSANWVIPYQGRGMNSRRAAAVWKMMVAPGAVTGEDCDEVFFEMGANSMRWANMARDDDCYAGCGTDILGATEEEVRAYTQAIADFYGSNVTAVMPIFE